MVIKKITLEKFKGVENSTYDFDGKNVRISGQNGSGKSTIMDAWCWLWFDKDSQLVSNPQIRPLLPDEESLEVSVTAELDIDGKPIKVQKSQKKKIDKTGKVSLTNTYSVNEVPRSERDFRLYFEELGVDFGNFLQLSHADVFTNMMSDKKTREAMRNTLFSMASDLSDLEVAEKTEGVEELKALLTNYKLEEVIAMQNATVRKIKETFGKDGELIDAEIQGKEALRVDIDIAELELQKKSLLNLISEKEQRLNDENKRSEDYKKQSNNLMELRFKLSDMERVAHSEYVDKTREHEYKLFDKEKEIKDLESKKSYEAYQLKSTNEQLEKHQKMLDDLKEKYTAIKAETMEENSFVCPTCGQELPGEQRESLKEDFEKKKNKRLAKVIEEGNDAKALRDKDKELIEFYTNSVSEIDKQIAAKQEELNELKSIVIVENTNVKDSQEYKSLENEIKQLEDAMNKETDTEDYSAQVKLEIGELNSTLKEVEKKLNSIEINEKIDTQIQELQDKKLQLSQEKANCERILYQIDLLNRSKNELLTEEINSHFKLVKFRMYTYLKNGEYKEDCTPMSLDGRVLGESTNTALSLQIKLDIIQGLQSFYGKNYPVFIDGAECLDTVNASNLKTDFQVIMLKVSDDTELKVEVF